MVTARRSKAPPPDLGHVDEVQLGPRRKLTAGVEADVRFAGKAQRTRARFVRGEADGSLTFADPRNRGLRTVLPDAVGTIHRERD